MSGFKAKMHQNPKIRLGLCPKPRWWSLQRSPHPLAGFKGPTSKGRGVEGMGEEEWEESEVQKILKIDPAPSPHSFSPPLPPSFPRGPHPINQLGGLGERRKRSPSRQMIWCISEQFWWQQILCIFMRIDLNFCTNTKLLSSRYSVSLRAKHSVGSRGKAPGQGVSRGTKSTWSWSCW